MSEHRASELISKLSLNSGDWVLDAGCGSAEFLINLSRATGCLGFGIDIDQAVLDLGAQRAGDLIEAGRLDLKRMDLRNSNAIRENFDVVICLGSSHAFAEAERAYPEMLECLNRLIRPNGKILIGECFWKKEPEPDYLKLIGEPVGVYRSFDENIACAASIGLRVIEADQATLQEWDTFEQDHLRRAEDRMSDASAGSDVEEKLKTHREWYEGYEKWGRETMGFGFYLFQRAT
ncbi:class I SAM-dependent methyltransferase [Hyphomonas sp. FCG-A18]|uniref:SAM-dependent methyltransferase n=1 Tax=Hyphomonas sp. FCG-A18 TaxID=3080019 RepID=UPI002B2F4F3D|nr:class I SAM-dependent methyltransferase [Hyphomonas sp. FCG-A18]